MSDNNKIGLQIERAFSQNKKLWALDIKKVVLSKNDYDYFYKETVGKGYSCTWWGSPVSYSLDMRDGEVQFELENL